METIVLVIHIMVAFAVIGVILMQQGKGAEAGASFGAGASQTVFGSQGSTNFLSRVTAVLALIFFITSFSLAIMAKHKANAVSSSAIPVSVVVDKPTVAGDAPIPAEKLGKSTISSDAPVIKSHHNKGSGSGSASDK